MRLASLLFLGYVSTAQASLNCLDLTGEYYLEYPIVGKVTYLKADQTDCDTAVLFYKMKNGMSMTRDLVFDGAKRESARDDQAGWVSYEWMEIQKDIVKIYGEKIENGKAVETTLQTFTIDTQGNLIDHNETLSSSGKLTDKIDFKYERIVP